MRLTTVGVFGLGAALVLVSACQDAVDGIPGSWLQASIRGAHDAEYAGTGDFTVGSGHDDSVQFILNSRDLDAAVGQRLIIYRPGDGQPEPGLYTLAPLERRAGMLRGLTAFYYREENGRIEAFTGSTGELLVTESGADLIEGTFRFTGKLYCTSPMIDYFEEEHACGDPNRLTPSAPEVTVTGAFVARPLATGPVVVD